MNARKLIIDCDPGIDDSLALMLAAASKELALVGITTVSGTVPASMGAKNALKILSMIGKPDVPVYVGEETPLVRDYAGDDRNDQQPRRDMERVVQGDRVLFDLVRRRRLVRKPGYCEDDERDQQ